MYHVSLYTSYQVTETEMQKILSFIREKQSKKPDYIPAYALEFQIMCGLRRGEVPPLRWCDVHDGYIDIRREQLTVKRHPEKPEEDYFVNHTKT